MTAAAGSTYVAVAVASKIVKKGVGRGQASGQRQGSGVACLIVNGGNGVAAGLFLYL